MMTARTIPELFREQARAHPQKTLFWIKRSGQYAPMSWHEAASVVDALCAFLLQSQVIAGNRIAILCENRYEWGIADLAIQSVGAWTVPVYPSLTQAEVLTIFRDCQPVMAIASTTVQAQKLTAILAEVPTLRYILVMDADPPAAGCSAWAAALEQGRKAVDAAGKLLDQRRAAILPDDTATIIYTSGTTGEPKGVMLSHRNFLSNVEAALRAHPIGETDVHLSFLPLCHVFERMGGWYLMLMASASVGYADSMDTIPQNMTELRPTIMLGVPRFFEKLYHRIHAGFADAPPRKQAIIRWALARGAEVSARQLAGESCSLWLRAQHAIADRLVFRKLRQRLGGRLRFFVSGGAALSPAIGGFFHQLGVTILEGYGLTETSPVITANRLDALKFGTVGRPVDGVEVRIAEDGEILSRGPHIMQGYYRKPAETEAVLRDGWFHTGDIGHIDAEGFLVITDRKKDLIKTAGGKFIAPQKLENLFITDPLIAQAYVHGEQERYCVALIVPNWPRLAEQLHPGIAPAPTAAELCRVPQARDLIWQRVQRLQHDLAPFEQVKAIALLDHELSQSSGELTPTLKTKRTAVSAKYHEIIRRLYDAAP